MNKQEKSKLECKECDGEGRWFDASDFSNKMCQTCNGTGKRPIKK